VPRALSIGISPATAGSGTGQSAALPIARSHTSTRCRRHLRFPASRRLCSGCLHKHEVKVREPEMVCSGGIAISPNGADAVLFG
jgi:hypothetical protein